LQNRHTKLGSLSIQVKGDWPGFSEFKSVFVVPLRCVVTESVIALVGLLVVNGIPAADADDLAAYSLCNTRRIVEYDCGCHNEIERLIRERQALTAAKQQGDSPSIAQILLRDGELCLTEVNAHQGDIEDESKLV
jgi:hypothetical protein